MKRPLRSHGDLCRKLFCSTKRWNNSSFGLPKSMKTGLVTAELEKKVAQENLKQDSAQFAVASLLDRILSPSIFDSFNPYAKHGLYVYGSVGTGKSLLLDCFYKVAQEQPNKNNTIRRVHFHEFMLDVHKKLRSNKIDEVALLLAKENNILCFDEFQVTDVADAVVLHQLFKILFENKTTVVATSNRCPDDLYANGINRKALFEPFLELMKHKIDFADINSLSGNKNIVHDYRKLAMENSALRDPPTFLYPHKDQAEKLDQLWEQISGVPTSEAVERKIPVAMGREFTIPRYANGVARLTFNELCRAFVGAIDYMSLVNMCHTVFIEDVPRLNPGQYEDTRRFITLIDIVYDVRCKVVISCQCSLDELFSDSTSFKTAKGEVNHEAPAIFVTDKGGSSGRLTTMLGEDFEWSATGRLDASLAELSAKNDVGFALQRARSRLYEMQTCDYWVLEYQPLSLTF